MPTTDNEIMSHLNQSHLKNVTSVSIFNSSSRYLNMSSSSSKLFNYFNIFKSKKLKKFRKRSLFNSSFAINDKNNKSARLVFNSMNDISLNMFSTTVATATTSSLLVKSSINSTMIMYHHSKSSHDIEFETNEYYVDRGVETRGLSNMYLNYKPETGLRTASVLGLMLFLIVFYLLWKNRCKCGGGSNDSDYDMEYWLNYVDEQKIARKNREKYVHNPQLPDKVSDSREATEAWVIEHRKLWQNAIKKREKEKAKKHDDSKFNYLLKSKIKQNLINSNDLNNKINQNENIQDILLSPFRKLRQFNLSRNSSRFSSRFNNKTRLFQELDAKTQLLINYARIDAITNAKFNKFNSSPQAFTSSYLLGQNFGPSAYYIRQHQKQKLEIDQENFDKYKSVLSSKLSNPLLDVNYVIDSLAYQSSLNNSHIDLKNDTACEHESSSDQLIDFKEISQTQIIQKLLLNMLYSTRRRSQSWPRSKRDQLQMNNFNREIRLIYYQNLKSHLIKRKQQRKNSSTKAKIINRGNSSRRPTRSANSNGSKEISDIIDSNRLNISTYFDFVQPTTSKAAEFSVDLI